MAVHFPRLFTSLRFTALILLIIPGSNWNPGVPRIDPRFAAHQHLAGLPPDARAAISHLLGPIANDAWIEQGQLTASDGSEWDVFGSAAAVSGDTIVVGATGDDSEQGSAYVFVKPITGWADLTETAKLTASDGAALDWFGYSVAIDGDTIVVGAPGGPTGPTTIPGAAYVFVRPSAGWMDMTQTAKLTASDAAIDDRFGISVAIYGGTVAVGASFADIGMNGDQGAAYVFAKPSLGWANSTQTAKLTASDGAASDFLGWSVALNGDTVAAGAFGDTIGMNEDQGSAYVFVRPGADWVNMTETARLIASDGATDDTLGYSIAIDDDTVVAGANGDTIGSNQGQGSAYVFVRPAGGWASSVQTAKLTASDGQAMDWLGLSVAVSGETIVAGAFAHDVDGNDQQGSAYVYAKPAGGWADMTETDQLTASDGAAFDRLGWSASIDGDTVVVGAYTDSIGANSQQGSAYVFYYETRLRIYFPLIAR